MDTKTAFWTALKYHSAAMLPTLLGIGLFAAGLWFGLFEPLLTLFASPDFTPQHLLTGQLPDSLGFRPLLVFTTAFVGYHIHRIGRTTLLFKLFGGRLEAADDD